MRETPVYCWAIVATVVAVLAVELELWAGVENDIESSFSSLGIRASRLTHEPYHGLLSLSGVENLGRSRTAC